tara:strand:+ start:3698 stop:5044 length:1347 start_codon:yes stop_codon:yes gene_type:complete
MKSVTDVQVQPSNREAEEAILGSCLIGGRPIIENAMGWIKNANAFHFDDTKKLWKIIISMYRSNMEIDTVTVSNHFTEIYEQKEAYWISGLANEIPTTANVGQYAKIVWQKHIQREIGKSSYKLYKHSYKKYDTTINLLETHRRLTEELIDLAPELKKNTDTIVDDTISAMLTGSNIIPYNFWALDRPAGGMTRKEITVLGGRPGHGKTTLMVNVVRHLADNPKLKVMVFNREMSNTEMMKKLFVMESDELTYNLLRQDGTKDIIESNVEALEKLIKKKYKNIFMYENVRDLDETMREIGKIKPDVVIDDYIQLIRTSDGNKDRRFQLEEIMQEYKWAAKKWNFAGFLLSQLNREIERRIDPVPRMSDYSESGVIEQTAETAMFVFYGYNFDPTSFDEYESQIITAKARYGQIGNFVVGFCGDRCKFYGTPSRARKDEAKCLENRDKL